MLSLLSSLMHESNLLINNLSINVDQDSRLKFCFHQIVTAIGDIP